MDFLVLGAPAVIYTWYTATHNANIGQDRKYNRIKVTFYSPHSRQLELFLCFFFKVCLQHTAVGYLVINGRGVQREGI